LKPQAEIEAEGQVEARRAENRGRRATIVAKIKRTGSKMKNEVAIGVRKSSELAEEVSILIRTMMHTEMNNNLLVIFKQNLTLVETRLLCSRGNLSMLY